MGNRAGAQLSVDQQPVEDYRYDYNQANQLFRRYDDLTPEFDYVEYDYDPAGNLTSYGSYPSYDDVEMLWDAENRPLSTQSSGLVTQYAYNGYGDR